MSHVIEADDRGTVHLTSDLTGAKPHESFRVEVQGGTLMLRPLLTYPPDWDKTTPQQRAAAFAEAVSRFPASDIHLTDEQLRRENIYE